MSIHKIRITNFQKFQFLECGFTPITILTGTNSSGKSTVINALDLLINRAFKTSLNYPLSRLIVSNSRNKVGDFDSLLNYDGNQDSELQMSYPLHVYSNFHAYQLQMTLTYIPNKNSLNEGILKTARFHNDNLDIFKMDLAKNISDQEIDFISRVFDEGTHKIGYWIQVNPVALMELIGYTDNIPQLLIDYFKGYWTDEEDWSMMIIDELTGKNDFFQVDNFNDLSSYEGKANTIFTLIERFLKDIIRTHGENKIIVLPGQRSPANRIILDNHENYLLNILRDFDQRQLKHDSIQIKFINRWLQKFEIGSQLKLVRVEGCSYSILIFKDNKWINLSDFGYGVTQLVPIIISIGTYALPHYTQNITLCFEEPEANLHPNFQSRLADMFVDAESLRLNVIIETHSEYFIRKLQYLTATNALETEKITIFYFDENGNIHDMELQSDGNFKKDFGQGFFDESIRWKFELLKIKNRN